MKTGLIAGQGAQEPLARGPVGATHVHQDTHCYSSGRTTRSELRVDWALVNTSR